MPDQMVSKNCELASLKEKVSELEAKTTDLLVQNDYLQKLFERTPLGYQSLDENACFIEVNQAWLNSLGYSREEVIGRYFTDFLHPGCKDKFKENFPKFKAIGGVLDVEFEMVKKNGCILPVSFTGKIGLNSQRHFQQTHCIFQDLTERKKFEEYLKEKEERLQHISLLTSDISYSCVDDSDGYFSINWMIGAAEKICGYSIDEILAQRCWRFLVLEKDLAIFEENVIHLTPGVHRSCILRIRHKNGNTIWVACNTECVTSLGISGHKFLYGSIRDISESKRYEERLKHSVSLLEASLESTADGILIVDRQRKLVRWNEKFAHLFRIPENVLSSQDDHKAIQYILEQLIDPEGFISKTAELYEQPEISSFDNIEFLDGRIFERYSQPQEIGDSIVGRVWSFRDVTERKKAEDLLAQKEEKFRALFNNSQIALFRSRLDGSETLDINKKFLDIVGKTSEEILGKPSATLWADPEERKEMVRKLIADGNVSDFEFKMLHEQKGVRNCITSLTLYRDQGILEGSVADITERKQAEDALRQSRNLINDILETTPNLIYIYDLQEKFNVYSNSGLVDVIGYSSKEIKKFGDQLFAHILHPEDFAIVGAHHERLFFASEDHVQEVEYRLRHAKGHWVVLHSKDKPYLRDDNGKVKQIIGVAEDITIRKQAEKSLRESEEKFRTVASFIHNWEYWIDGDGNLAYVSPSCERITSYTAEEFYQDPALLTTIIHPDDRESFKQHVNETAKVKTKEDCRAQDFRILTRNGEERWIAHVCRDVFDQEGNPIGRRVSNRGITERKQAEAELIEYSQRLQLATASGKLAIWDWNVKDNIMYWDDHMFELYGISRDTFPKTLDAWINGLHPDDKQRAIDENNAACLGEKEFNTVFRVLHPDGIIKHIKADAMVIRDQNGKAVRMIGINTNITQQIRAEEERQSLEAQLQQAQKMEAVGQLAGGVAHDFNNMLGVILGHAEMSMDEMDKEHPLFNDLTEIRNAAQRSADITRQLLAFARKQTIAPKVVDLNTSVERMLKMLQRLIGEDVAILWKPGYDLWPVKIDPSQVDQILANLCVNGRDAISDVGTITIETDNINFDEEYCKKNVFFVAGDYVMLALSDTGCGMDQETQEHIFEPFFTTKGIGKGTGLGLATIYGIAKQNNGFINVYSEMGQGTTFKIYLPRYVSNTGQVWVEESSKPIKGGHETILLVEDEPTIMNMTSVMLQRLGYSVTAVGAPGEAIRIVEEFGNKIHLLITDLIMPRMNGRDLSVKLLAKHPEMKILFMSGYTANVIAHRGVLDDGVHFLQKPFSKKDLATKVRMMLDNRENL